MSLNKHLNKLDKAIGLFIINKRTKLISKKINNEFKENRIDIAIYNSSVLLMNITKEGLHEVLNQENKQKNAILKVKVATVSFIMASAGAIFSPTLSLLSLIGIGYITIYKFKGAWAHLKQYKIGVDLFGVIAIVTCLSLGYYVLASFSSLSYSISYMLLEKIKDQSRKEVIEIFKECPSFVWLISDSGSEVRIPFPELVIGDIIVVQAGEVVPVDGSISRGIASIDERTLTGESQPAEKKIGDSVFASTVVLSGKIYIKVNSTGENTIIAKIGAVLNNTSSYQTSQEINAQKMTDKTLMPTFLFASLSLPFLGIYKSAALLNAHFKYKMTILSPISILSHLKLFSDQGILIKDGRSLDLLNKVDTIVFDKTGTLTQEQPSITKIFSFGDYSENEILVYAATAEQKQNHPIAQAILEEARERDLEILPINDSQYKIGYGITVKIQEKLIRIGSYHFMKLSKVNLPTQVDDFQNECHQKGHSVVMVAEGLKLIGAIEFGPSIRINAKQVIAQLKKDYGIKEYYIISGDHEAPTKYLAEKLGIDNYFAETLPEDKAKIIKQLQDKGKFVCYVGDGVNDSIALKQSQVSVSLKGASSAAQDAAQIILMEVKLNQLVHLFEIARDFKVNINQCFACLVSATVIGMSSVLFLHMGLFTTIIIGHGSLAAGVWTATKPLRKKQKNRTRICVKNTGVSTFKRITKIM